MGVGRTLRLITIIGINVHLCSSVFLQFIEQVRVCRSFAYVTLNHAKLQTSVVVEIISIFLTPILKPRFLLVVSRRLGWEQSFSRNMSLVVHLS